MLYLQHHSVLILFYLMSCNSEQQGYRVLNNTCIKTQNIHQDSLLYFDEKPPIKTFCPKLTGNIET